MSGEFVADYVQECITKGIQSPPDIRKRAEEEISKINEEIQKIEVLRTRQGSLRAVIRHMGGGTKSKKTTSKSMDFTMSWEDLEDSFQELCISICRYIEDDEGKLPRDIMDHLSSEQKSVYSAIKWLEHNDIIGRRDTDEGRAIVRGRIGLNSPWEAFSVQIMGDERVL